MLSSLRNFFLALFFSLVVFGIGGYFLVGYVNELIKFGLGIDIVEEDPNSALPGEDPNNTENVENSTNSNQKADRLTAIIMGLDDGLSQLSGKSEADCIYIIDINTKTQKLMISSIPYETKVAVKGYLLRLGAVMSEYGLEATLSAIKALTGITPDYYYAVEYSGLLELMNILGEVDFDVPMDMYYMPTYDPPANKNDSEDEEETEEAPKPEINLKMGRQPIDGEKALQLFRYKDYSNGNIGRIDTQLKFIKELIRQKVTFENLTKANDLYRALKSCVTTNMKDIDFSRYIDLIFSISSYTITELQYPGTIGGSLDNGVLFFSPQVDAAIRQYQEYRKDTIK